MTNEKFKDNPFKDDFKIPVSTSSKEEVETPEKIEVKEESAASVADRIKLMQQHRLRADMVNVGGPIDFSEFEIFLKILNEYKKEDRYKEVGKKVGWSQKKLAAHYILEGIKRDKKKIENK